MSRFSQELKPEIERIMEKALLHTIINFRENLFYRVDNISICVIDPLS